MERNPTNVGSTVFPPLWFLTTTKNIIMKAILTTAALLAASTALASAATEVKKISTTSELTAFYDQKTGSATAKTDGGVSLATGEWTQISGGGLWSADYTGLSNYNTAIAVSFWMKSDYDASNLTSYATNTSHPDWSYQAIWQSGDVSTSSSITLGLSTDGTIRLNFENLVSYSSGKKITAGEWYNVGFVFYQTSNTTSELSLYINGELEGNVHTATTKTENGKTYDASAIAYNNDNARLAQSNKSMTNAAPYYTGGIDELTVWSVTSTADGAAAIKAAYTSVIPEPSAFGLLAGIGALAFAISRRRRVR